MNRLSIIAAMGILCFPCASGAESDAAPAGPRNGFVGVWQETDGDMIMEILADGSLNMMPADPAEAEGFYVAMKWSVTPDGKLELSEAPGGETMVMDFTVGDTLTLKPPDGHAATFRRLNELPTALKALKPAGNEVLEAARDRALMVRMLSNGRNIHMAMMVAEMDGAGDAAHPVYPRDGTSTGYFAGFLLKKKLLEPAPGFFGGPGLPVEAAADQLKAENVAWLLLADAENAPANLPVLLSRNARVSKVSDLKGRIADTLSDQPPFGKTAVLFIRKDGSARACIDKDLDATWETLLGDLPEGEPDRKYLQP